MIQQLSIRNIALIEELTIGLKDGLNVLTGETGAGKSILIDAVNLVLGERADRELIKTGTDAARVEILFSLKKREKVDSLLQAFGIPSEEDGSLLLMRELTNQGKNTCRINGRSVTLSMLREISRLLVDIHGQHQHQSLLAPETHIEILDRLGGAALVSMKSKLYEVYTQWMETVKEIRKITGDERDAERRKDLLRYQIDEIRRAEITPGEEEAVRKERTLLLHGEKILQAVSESYQELYAGTVGRPAMIDSLGTILSRFEPIKGYDEQLLGISDLLEGLQAQLDEAVLQIRSYKEDFEYDPNQLEVLESRLELIRALKRKYGSTIDEILSCERDLTEELDNLENSQARLSYLNDENLRLERIVLEHCQRLSMKRKELAAWLEMELIEQLKNLHMEKTRFSAAVVSAKSSITSQGYDSVEFMISPNPGEPLKPLSKIVSGGEMSRIMLALKTILGSTDEIPTLIFDEIDVGISGRTASRVAEKMAMVSRDRQILCVTHLPQIAAIADTHFIIQKIIEDKRTLTTMKELDFSARKMELARMIGGDSVTPLSLEHAYELIVQAENVKKSHEKAIN